MTLLAALALQTQAGRLSERITSTVTLAYLVAFPEGYDADKRKRWPVVFFLHASGEKGDDLGKLRVHGPLKEIANGRKIPALVVAPQCPNGDTWDSDRMVQALHGLFRHVERTYRVDRKRELLTGISMGGYGVWAVGIKEPRRFAALAPICGNGDVAKVAALRDEPIWTVHGDADGSVPVQGTRDLVAALRASGGHVRYDEIPGAGHDVWSRTYAQDAFWDWLLAQKRP